MVLHTERLVFKGLLAKRSILCSFFFGNPIDLTLVSKVIQSSIFSLMQKNVSLSISYRTEAYETEIKIHVYSELSIDRRKIKKRLYSLQSEKKEKI